MSPSPLWVIIPAAGYGRRFSATVPKQYQPLLNKTVLEQTLARFSTRPDVSGIVLAVAADDQRIHTLDLPAGVTLVQGGLERSHSVAAALDYLMRHCAATDRVAIHDAARPCVRQSLLDRLFADYGDIADGVIPALPASDTVKHCTNGRISQTLDRSRIYLAQTPQLFTFARLYQAMQQLQATDHVVTDDASVIEWAGGCPRVINGDKANIKITTADDLALAEWYLTRILQEGD